MKSQDKSTAFQTEEEVSIHLYMSSEFSKTKDSLQDKKLYLQPIQQEGQFPNSF